MEQSLVHEFSAAGSWLKGIEGEHEGTDPNQMKHISLISSQFAGRTYIGFGRRFFGPYIFHRAAVLSRVFVDLCALGKNHLSVPFPTNKQCL